MAWKYIEFALAQRAGKNTCSCATRHCNMLNAPRPEASQANSSATAQRAVPSG
ncbi:hypothetical protein A2U01_0099643, partial [Trifolium medium]|nr:hypothetical protein [Trifolium medium]